MVTLKLNNIEYKTIKHFIMSKEDTHRRQDLHMIKSILFYYINLPGCTRWLK